MGSASRRTVLVILHALLVSICPAAGEPGPAGDAQLVIEEFDVASDGDLLIVPLQVGGREFSFVVDTGASEPWFDKGLEPLLGKPKRVTRAQAVNGHVAARFFDPPPLQLGKLIELPRCEVGSSDLTILRQVFGQEIYGFIGTRALRPHIVRLDFDHGKLSFLRSAGNEPGVQVPLVYDQTGLPEVEVNLANWGPERFHIDTGCVGQHSGSLKTQLFQTLDRKGVLQPLRPTLVGDLAGNWQIKSGVISGLSLGGFLHSNLKFDEHTVFPSNLLGLGFLSRFIVTFDFPNSVMYLKPSRQFDRPDVCDLSGLHFLRRDGEVSIEKVDPGSPATDAGILAKDLLLAVDGADASTARLFPLRRLLSTPHKTVRLELRRGDQKFEVSLKLPASPIGPGVAEQDDPAPPQKSAKGPDRRPKRGSTR